MFCFFNSGNSFFVSGWTSKWFVKALWQFLILTTR